MTAEQRHIRSLLAETTQLRRAAIEAAHEAQFGGQGAETPASEDRMRDLAGLWIRDAVKHLDAVGQLLKMAHSELGRMPSDNGIRGL